MQLSDIAEVPAMLPGSNPQDAAIPELYVSSPRELQYMINMPQIPIQGNYGTGPRPRLQERSCAQSSDAPTQCGQHGPSVVRVVHQS